MKLKELAKNKKGVSSLFIAIYVAMFAVLLFSTIFVGITISTSSLVDALKVEENRMLESIKLTKIEYSSANSRVQSLLINNTGAITVCIRAVYIDQKFIYDPNTAIAPKEARTVQFPPLPVVILDNIINASVTATTERGTKTTETVTKLIGISDDQNDPNKFYCGPLMILYNMFHWKSEPSGSWTDGWTIPKSSSTVTWRILVADVDSRALTLNLTSAFMLVSNDNAPKNTQLWYIDPMRTQLTIYPDRFSFVYFSNSQITGSNTICINFLVIQGVFSDGTPFGQTIPFEAVRISP
jgi:hypothetical protein